MQYNNFSGLLLFLGVIMTTSCQEEANEPSLKNSPLTQVVQAENLRMVRNEGRVYYQGKPFTGTSVAYYHNGSQASEMEYVEGKKHGRYTKWFANGHPSYECCYQEGKKHGRALSWWRNGHLRTRSNYDQGIPHGKQMQWYISGTKFKKINLVYGKEEGLQQSWRKNGKLYNNYEAKNGRTFGLRRTKLCYQLNNGKIQQTK